MKFFFLISMLMLVSSTFAAADESTVVFTSREEQMIQSSLCRFLLLLRPPIPIFKSNFESATSQAGVRLLNFSPEEFSRIKSIYQHQLDRDLLISFLADYRGPRSLLWKALEHFDELMKLGLSSFDPVKWISVPGFEEGAENLKDLQRAGWKILPRWSEIPIRYFVQDEQFEVVFRQSARLDLQKKILVFRLATAKASTVVGFAEDIFHAHLFEQFRIRRDVIEEVVKDELIKAEVGSYAKYFQGDSIRFALREALDERIVDRVVEFVFAREARYQAVLTYQKLVQLAPEFTSQNWERYHFVANLFRSVTHDVGREYGIPQFVIEHFYALSTAEILNGIPAPNPHGDGQELIDHLSGH